MNSIIVEIRGAEGGAHSKLLVKDMAITYRKVCEKNKLDLSVIEDRPGFMSLLVEGHGASRTFANEPGGHRWQTVSPTDKKGRIHTSTVTVAVLDPDDNKDYKLDMKEVEIKTTRSGGNGGQNVNKVESCVVVTHKPTKISVRISNRDQHQNKRIALRILTERLSEIEKNAQLANKSNLRRNQVGSGMRADKRRTYREKDNQVIDHITGCTWAYNKWIRGQW